MQKDDVWLSWMVAATMVILFGMMIAMIVRRPATTNFMYAVDLLMLLIAFCALVPAAALSMWLGVRLFWGE